MPVIRISGGLADAFVTKLDANGQGPVYSTYLGGNSWDCFVRCGIAVDGAGNAYISGETYSSDFPTVNAPYPNFGEGLTDGFVTKFNASGQGPIYSTYFGGSFSPAAAYGIAVDRSGNAYLTGFSACSLPTINPYCKSFVEAFVTKIADTDLPSEGVYLDLLDAIDFRSGATISSDPHTLANLPGHPMTGVATDGEARLLLRARTSLPGSVTFSIPDGDGLLSHYQDGSSGSSVIVQTVPVNGEHMAFAIYRAPEQFPRMGHNEDKAVGSRPTSLTLQTSDGARLDRTLVLARPPLVLIHGLWADKSSWYDFVPKLRERIAGLAIYKANYWKDSAKSFAENMDVPRQYIATAIKDYRDQLGSVDVRKKGYWKQTPI